MSNFKREETYALYALDFPNGKSYGGISKNPRKRFLGHLKTARRGGHLIVSRAIRKYGAENISMRVLCYGLRSYIADLEIRYLAARHLTDIRYGYNISLGGDLSPMSVPESVEKMRQWHLGKPLTPEHKAAIGFGNTGREVTVETRAKIGAKHAGVPKGPMSEEHKASIALALTGIPKSKEHKQALVVAAAKRPPEHYAALSSPEKCAKQSSIALRQHATMDPEVKRLREERIKASWADPEIRALRIANQKAAFARKREARLIEALLGSG